MKRSELALLAVLGAALVGGGGPVFVKISLKEIPALSFIFLRFFFSSLIILPWFLKRKLELKQSWLKLVLVSLFSTANIVLFTFGIRLTTATTGQIIYVFVPIITALIALALAEERLNRSNWLGIILGFLGTSLVVFLPALKQGLSQGGSLQGNLLILAGAGLYAFYLIFSKKLQKQFSPLDLTTAFLFITTLVSLVFVPKEITLYPGWLSQVSLTAWGALAYVVILQTIIYYLLTQYAIKYGSATIGSLTLYLQPAATYVWAAILLGEQLSLVLLTGGLMALLGTWLVTHNQAKD
jgi:drug/metabolite transporter (DMT)-like permease